MVRCAVVLLLVAVRFRLPSLKSLALPIDIKPSADVAGTAAVCWTAVVAVVVAVAARLAVATRRLSRCCANDSAASAVAAATV